MPPDPTPNNRSHDLTADFLEKEVQRLRSVVEARERQDMDELKQQLAAVQQGQTLIAQQLVTMKSEFASAAELQKQAGRISVLELDKAKTVGAIAILGCLTLISGTVSWLAHASTPGK